VFQVCKDIRQFFDFKEVHHAEDLINSASEQKFKVAKNSDNFIPDFTVLGICSDLHLVMRVIEIKKLNNDIAD
jgi:hypothetical protein